MLASALTTRDWVHSRAPFRLPGLKRFLRTRSADRSACDGDVVIVTKYDRLARSLKDLLEIVEAIRERGADFRSLAENIDTTTSTGRLVFHFFASIIQFERERNSERTKEGLASARKRGRAGGRLSALTAFQKDEVRRIREVEIRAISEIARLFGVSGRTVKRA